MSMTRQQKRKLARQQKKSGSNILFGNDSELSDIINEVSKMLGTSTKVGEKNEGYSSGRIDKKDRISYKSPTEEDLLIKFKKTTLEVNFKRISDYAALYADFEERFYEKDRSVDIESMNNTLTQEEVHYYFTELEDTGMDLINNMCDLASYAKNKDYLELQKNIINASKKMFKPRMVGLYTSFADIPKDMNDIITGLRSVQSRYVEGAPYIASAKKIKIDSIEGRTKAFLEYKSEMVKLAQDPLYAMTNNLIESSEDLALKPKRSRLSMSEVIGLNAEYAIEIKTGTQEELIQQAKPLIKEFKELEQHLKVIPETMINSNGILDYSLAKQAFKSSGLKLGSTNDYLNTFKPMYSRMIALINSLCEIAFANSNNSKNVDDKNDKVALYIDEELSLGVQNRDIYNLLMGAIERSVGKFIVFCEEKGLKWNSETSLKKAAGKFDKSWERKVYMQESNEANKILEEMLSEKINSNPRGRMLAAAIEADQFIDNREFIYTPTMLNTQAIIENCNYNEDKILAYMNLNSILAFEDYVDKFFDLFTIFINNDLLVYNFHNKVELALLKDNEKEEIINNFSNFIEAWLLYINNTVAFYYFAKKVGFKKITVAVENEINSLNKLLEVEEDKSIDYLQKLEELAKLIPEVLIFANRKGYQFNSAEKAEELNKKFLKSKES